MPPAASPRLPSCLPIPAEASCPSSARTARRTSRTPARPCLPPGRGGVDSPLRRPGGPPDTGAVIDAQARSAYRQRLRELEEAESAPGHSASTRPASRPPGPGEPTSHRAARSHASGVTATLRWKGRSMSRTSKADAPVSPDEPAIEGRYAELDGYTAGVETHKADMDPAPSSRACRTTAASARTGGRRPEPRGGEILTRCRIGAGAFVAGVRGAREGRPGRREPRS